MKRYEETWVVTHRPGDVSELMRRFGISDVCARILWNRGYRTAESVERYLYGNGTIEWPALPGEREWIAEALAAIAEGGRFRVVGDYDVDGVTATYLMVTALRMLGADVDYRIPDRVADGYGISEEMVEKADRDGVRTIITVDNGIAAVKQIALAKSLGMRVLVTDHHEPQASLPPADAIVDPKTAPENERIDNLCGAVVAGILADRLLDSFGMDGFADKNAEILALATVCDVMPLSGIARDIVRRGLRKPIADWNGGLQTLARTNNIDSFARCYHMGFILGPCINALGRLETADYGVELLLTGDVDQQRECARRMVEVNNRRKEQTVLYTGKACDLAEKMLDEADTPVLILYLPQCHESIVGIVAGKVRERFCRPTFVLTDSIKEPGMLKGSGRSTESFDMFAGMMECRDLFERFGGHAMAAGVSLRKEHLASFRDEMADAFRKQESVVLKKMTIDLVMPFRYISEELIDELSLMEPFGNGNTKPVFAQKNVTIERLRYIGKDSQYLAMTLRDAEGTVRSGVYFGDVDEFTDALCGAYGTDALDLAFDGRGRILTDMLYYPEKNEYKGSVTLQVQMTDYHISAAQ